MTSNQLMFRSLINGEEGTLIRKGLETSSVSAEDAESRAKEWDKVFSNLDEIVEDRMYAGAGAPGQGSVGLHGIEFFDATVAAMIKSYAGIFSVERSMEQPNASLPYLNLYGVAAGDLIAPNIGVSNIIADADGYANITKTATKAEVDGASGVITADTTGPEGNVTPTIDNIPIIPGSVKVSINYNTVSTLPADSVNVVITDNGAGSLLAPAGILTAGTVTYGSETVAPVISFDFAPNLFAGSSITYSIEFIKDLPKKLGNKVKGEVEYYTAKTSPVIVPYEVNQVANLSAKKALGIDMRKLTLTQVTDEYTKIINKKTVTQIGFSAKSKNEVTLDLSNFTVATSDFRTYLESFMAQLRMIDTRMAKKTEKAINITAYLVSLTLGDIFSQLEMVTSKWVPNKDMSFVDDVIGYYSGIPVVRSKYVSDVNATTLQGYAIHKTKEGQLAPLMRGTFLPLTNMDEVGSFDNPLLKSGGIFSYEGVSRLTQDLTIGFQVKPGVGTVIS